MQSDAFCTKACISEAGKTMSDTDSETTLPPELSTHIIGPSSYSMHSAEYSQRWTYQTDGVIALQKQIWKLKTGAQR